MPAVEAEILHEPVTPRARAVARRPLYAYAAVVFGFMLLFWPVITHLVGQWYTDADYSYGFLVPLFSGFLIWQKREQLAQLQAQPSNWGLAIVLFSLGLLFLGSLGAELFLTRIALLGTVIGLVIFLLGFGMLRALAFPLGFLFLMVPLPVIVYNEIVFPLQLMASRFAATCLQNASAIPVLREGNLLILPNYTLEVVEACSGIRSLMSLTALALAYGYVVEPRRALRWVLLAVVVPIAVLSNGLRVISAAIAVYYFGPAAGEGLLHATTGLVIFFVATILLLAVHRLLVGLSRARQQHAAVAP
jgi:exosortase